MTSQTAENGKTAKNGKSKEAPAPIIPPTIGEEIDDAVAEGREVVMEVHCRPRTAFMAHGMPVDVIEKVLVRKGKMTIDTESPLRELARKGLYIAPAGSPHEGKHGIPGDNLFSCLLGGGRFVKFDGRRMVCTKEEALLPSFLTVLDDFIPFLECPEGDAAWEADLRRGQMNSGATSVAVGIIRPLFKKEHWSFKAKLQVNLGSPVTEQMVRQIIKMAGLRAGLGSFRPSCRGRFGMFEVAGLKIIEELNDDKQAAPV